MDGALLADPIMERLRRRYPMYHEMAYLFVLAALKHTIDRLNEKEPRHITGREMAVGCRDLALERYGPMARSVLAYWGIRSTRDFGEIVFALVDLGILVKQDDDSLDDFDGVFCFAEAFEQNYPWACPGRIEEN
jgi:uncharacterized repeat protein (TIGR04138 family)